MNIREREIAQLPLFLMDASLSTIEPHGSRIGKQHPVCCLLDHVHVGGIIGRIEVWYAHPTKLILQCGCGCDGFSIGQGDKACAIATGGSTGPSLFLGSRRI